MQYQISVYLCDYGQEVAPNSLVKHTMTNKGHTLHTQNNVFNEVNNTKWIVRVIITYIIYNQVIIFE
jgi:hypothetical protein